MAAKRSRPKGQTGRRSGDVSRAVLVVFALALVFAAGRFMLSSKPFGEPAPPPPAATSEAEARTGMIQLAPDNDNTCRQFAFDNTSGKLRDKGSVSCAEPPQQSADRPDRWLSNSHIDTIREGFKKR
jgi:hypothetical protein